MRSGIRRYALRVDSEGMMVPDVKKGVRGGVNGHVLSRKKKLAASAE